MIRRARSTIWAAAIAIVPALSVLPQGFFEATQVSSIPLLLPPTALRLADFDGDGRLDLAVTHAAEARVSVVLQRPGEEPRTASYPVGLSPVKLASGDLDADGDLDLVSVNGGSGSLTVLRSRGDGTFERFSDPRVTGGPIAAALVDADEDGGLDAVVISVTGAELGVFTLLHGDGKCGFDETNRFTVGDNPHSVVARDFDGDGPVDIAVAHTSTISWFRGAGRGTFERPKDTTLNENPRGLVGGDFDLDGLVDLAVTTDSAALLSLRRTTGGLFEPRRVVNTGISGSRDDAVILSLDFDADGKLDLAVQTQSSTALGIRILRGLANAAFEDSQSVFLGDSSSDFALADWDGDQVLDLVASRPTEDAVLVVHGARSGRIEQHVTVRTPISPRQIAIADLRGDGTRSIAVPGIGQVQIFQPEADRTLREGKGLSEDGVFRDLAPGEMNGVTGEELALVDIASNRVVIATSSPAGELAVLASHAIDGFPGRLIVYDLDLDGLDDLIVRLERAASATVILRPGLPLEARQLETPLPGIPTALTTVDANGDGLPDLCLGAADGFWLLAGDGHGTFGQARPVQLPPSAAQIESMDMDGDGELELLAAHPARGEIDIARDWARGGEPKVSHLSLEIGFKAFRVIDIDGDSHPEIVVLGSTPENAVLLNRGLPGGKLAGPESYFLGGGPQAFAMADVDGDGAMDCVTANPLSSSISVLWGRPGAAPGYFRRGDSNGDGHIDITDAVSTLHALFLGAGPLACVDAADADDSGELNLTDAVAILLHLFRGGAALPAPGPVDCGADPILDALPACERSCP